MSRSSFIPSLEAIFLSITALVVILMRQSFDYPTAPLDRMLVLGFGLGFVMRRVCQAIIQPREKPAESAAASQD